MIQIEKTPNPNSLKFLTERTVSSIGSEEFQSKNLDKIDNIFIKELLSLNGVELILLAKNFLTVKKNDKVSWDALKPSVISYLNDYFNKNQQPILQEIKKKGSVSDENEIIIKIKEVLDTKIRPAVARDGGDIKFKSYEKGVVKLELQGSCSGCPSSAMTLKQGVQNLLKHYVQEVESVEAV
jgi:Fe-S cluster biogenesis protein NfuA